MINCHFHDDHSFDGVDPLLSHCERAEAEGLKHMCVTNHAEVLEPDGSWTVDSSVLNQGLPDGIALARAAGWSEFTVYEGRRHQVRVPIEEAEEWVGSAAAGAGTPQEEVPV